MSERPNVIFALLLVATIPLAALLGLGLVLLGGVGIAFSATALVGVLSFCVLLLRDLAHIPLAWVGLVALTALSLAVFARTLAAHVRERRLLAALPLEPVHDPALRALAARAGIADLALAPTRLPAAFCFGSLRPRVVITNGLLERLAPEELAAVLWHESHHVCHNVPLKCLVGRLVSRTFFWVPLLRGLLERYLLLKELAADRLAIERAGLPALAAALSEVALAGKSPVSVIGLGDFAAARIDRLFDATAPLPPLVRGRQAIASGVALASVGLLLLRPPVADFGDGSRLHQMLTTLSLHGLPGMAVGIAANIVALALGAEALRRVRHLRIPARSR